LYFRNRRATSITKSGQRQAELLFVVTLSEEFFAHFLTPLATYIPRSTRVADIGAFQRYLQYKMTVFFFLHLKRVLIQIFLQQQENKAHNYFAKEFRASEVFILKKIPVVIELFQTT
jgi:hypothetical protein